MQLKTRHVSHSIIPTMNVRLVVPPPAADRIVPRAVRNIGIDFCVYRHRILTFVACDSALCCSYFTDGSRSSRIIRFLRCDGLCHVSIKKLI